MNKKYQQKTVFKCCTFKYINRLIDRYICVDRYQHVDIESIKYYCSTSNIKIFYM